VKKRQVSYRWRLREVMAEHGMFATTELVPLLAARGITLSPSQVHRLVTGTPQESSRRGVTLAGYLDHTAAQTRTDHQL
jgi:hypothetical protein